MNERICITVQLSHQPSKFDNVKISHAIIIDPLDLAIEASLGEEKGFGKILPQEIKLLVRS